MTPKKSTAKAPKADDKQESTSAVSISGTPLSTRGRTFVGEVVSDRMAKTVTVVWGRRTYIPKYQRYEKRRTKVKAHDELGAKTGDTVEIKETRPISKTKTFIVTQIIKRA